MKQKFSFAKRALSFRYAWRGICFLIRNEHNAWLHLSILLIVIMAGFYYDITLSEWIRIVVVSGMVLALEAVNTAIEKLCDHIMPDKNETIAVVKDVAAGAVLIAAISAAIVGLIIFLPYIIA